MTLFEDGTVSLTTVENRVRPKLLLPDDDDGYQYRYLDDEQWSVTESSLTIRDGAFYLHLGFRRPKEQTTAEGGAVLGVDFGIENLAVTSTARFFSGREALHEHKQFERRRASLQQTGTRSARHTLKQLSNREQRRHQHRLHRIANGILSESSRRTGTRQCALKSGTVTANGTFVPR